MSAPLGGSLTELMAAGDTLIDQWVDHAKRHNASTPELVAGLLIQFEETPNTKSVLAVMVATAVQRLTSVEV